MPQEQEGDIVLVDAPEGYEKLWRKALVFLQGLVDGGGGRGPQPLHYVMHADDDSLVRLDLLLPLLVRCVTVPRGTLAELDEQAWICCCHC